MNQGLQYEINAVMPAAVVTGLFPSLCTFQDRAGAATPVLDPLGQVDLADADYENVAGLVDIPCMIAAVSQLKPLLEGGRTQEYNFEAPQRHILLNDWYPQVLQRYLAIVDGVTYSITPGGVESDSQQQQTRLTVRAYQL